MTRKFTCQECGELIDYDAFVDNDEICDTCLFELKDDRKYVWQGINNIDLILEDKRRKVICKR